MKFRLILDTNEPEITIITEDGGIACIREAEDIGPLQEDKRVAVSDYYSVRIPDLESFDGDNLFEALADESTIYHEDWSSSKYNSIEVITAALSWLNTMESDWELVNDIYLNVFPLVNKEQL